MFVYWLQRIMFDGAHTQTNINLQTQIFILNYTYAQPLCVCFFFVWTNYFPTFSDVICHVFFFFKETIPVKTTYLRVSMRGEILKFLNDRNSQILYSAFYFFLEQNYMCMCVLSYHCSRQVLCFILFAFSRKLNNKTWQAIREKYKRSKILFSHHISALLKMSI